MSTFVLGVALLLRTRWISSTSTSNLKNFLSILTRHLCGFVELLQSSLGILIDGPSRLSNPVVLHPCIENPITITNSKVRVDIRFSPICISPARSRPHHLVRGTGHPWSNSMCTKDPRRTGDDTIALANSYPTTA